MLLLLLGIRLLLCYYDRSLDAIITGCRCTDPPLLLLLLVLLWLLEMLLFVLLEILTLFCEGINYG